ncbi:MAG: MupG family TIM beta-alpha barrel fold protein [Clostridiales bacterium]|jgi:hypothetical protein|nr:MupG family TIM beta-alpha barrel fold protein [Clostridiales bacterium]
MLFSLYSTDSKEVWDRVVDLATQNGEKEMFCSLHIPEADNLQNFLEFLKQLHINKGFNFTADISPLTLKKLSLTIENLNEIRKYGINCLRIDFGFSAAEIIRIGKAGFKIAVNASVVNESFINELKGLSFFGWHNYYPRPETGIDVSYFKSQNELFKKYNLPVYTFIPGDSFYRAPLHMGLPVIESQRFQNTYVNFIEMKKLAPGMPVCVAEGLIYKRHLRWINEYEASGIITIPLSNFDELSKSLDGKCFYVRKEEANISWRLEDTRKLLEKPQEILNASLRKRGSLQMDTSGYGRYEGEIHIMTKDSPLHPYVIRISEIPSPYINLVDFLDAHPKIRFEII